LNVLVFIHGGAFMFLYGSIYQPDYILDKDIILVTFNYRLGPIGNILLWHRIYNKRILPVFMNLWFYTKKIILYNLHLTEYILK